MLTPLPQEFFGIQRGRFEIDTWHSWIDCPPHIPLVNLNAPVAVAVAVPAAAPPLHPIKALVRDVVQSADWQHLVVAIVAVGFLTSIVNREA